MDKEEKIDKYLQKTEPYLITVIISSFIGVLGGILGALFIKTIDIFTEIRNSFSYILLLMPLIGLLIVYITKKCKTYNNEKKLINEAIIKNKDIPDHTVPEEFITTTLSHLAGASVGRLETPIKMGGGVGAYISKFFDLKNKKRSTAIASGVAAFFSAIFGAPLTGTILACELCITKQNKKPIYILPVLLSACFSRFICFALGLNSFIDRLIFIHHADYNLKQIIPILLLIGISLIFCLLFNKILDITKKLFNKIKNDYIRIIIGSIIMLIAIYLIGNTLFCGNETELVKKALENNHMWYTFILKTILTALCLSIGFKGGKVGPAFICGATLGILLSSFMGIDSQMGAAIGAITLFGGTTGCIITSVALGIEIFGLKSVVFFIIIALLLKLFINQKLIEKKY